MGDVIKCTARVGDGKDSILDVVNRIECSLVLVMEEMTLLVL